MQRHERPLTHEWIWGAIDTLARRRSLTPSALARLAGLDPTTFNRSKRFTPEGRPRWPNTESISKLLAATGTSLDDFAAIELTRPEADADPFDDPDAAFLGLPVVGRIRDARIDDWQPAAGIGEPPASRPTPIRRFALVVADGSLEPVYSSGNTLVVSETSATRPGDRVLVKPTGMPVLPRLVVSASPNLIELDHLSGRSERLAVEPRDIDWIARIVLVRQ